MVDPTGAGNGFMGGLAAALDDGLDVQQGTSFAYPEGGTMKVGRADYSAVIWGTVAASLIVEQPGLPVLSDDRWNGDAVQSRIQILEQRMRRE